jgi:hypothetical protein
MDHPQSPAEKPEHGENGSGSVCVRETPDGKTAPGEPKEKEKESERQKPESPSHRYENFQYF